MSDRRRVVVIGSGPAGAMAAHELVRNGIPTTMLESGTKPPSGLLVRAAGRNVFRWGDPVESSNGAFVAGGDPATRWTFNLALGGLSNQWTGAVPRFSAADFYEGERLHERYRWPLDYGDLAPFYADAERLVDMTAGAEDVAALPAGEPRHLRALPADWQRVAMIAAKRGQGLTVLPLADGPPWLFARRGTAFNSYSGIVRGLVGRPDFELKVGAHALQVAWSGRRRRIESVLYADRASGEQHSIDVDGVVVACGALLSTKLLFDSACADFPDGIGNEHGLLGRYLHDHPKEWWSFATDRPVSRLAPAAYLTRRPYDESTPLLATSWTLGLSSTSPAHRLLSLTRLKTHHVGVQVFGTMRPVAEHFVRPHPAALDEFGLPQLEVTIAFPPDELDNVIASRQHLVELMADAGYTCELDPVDPQLVPGVAVHYGGTVRMHRSPEFGVLNEWNRPFAVPNLVVADASCFTTNSEKNPTLTAMALAARAARRLATDVRSGG
jgi:choline dehydrogenase-like flavoprotein